VLHEATYRQLLELAPNVAVLPWGATEAHNYHLPYGTDVIEATRVGEEAVAAANAAGARCVLLPTIPFGIDHTQLNQVATITMRAATQSAVLHDVADSLVRQGIDRLVILNFHGGNDFRSMIRDVAFALPIFIAQIHAWQVDPGIQQILDRPGGDHADEMETSLLLHLAPRWVAPLETAGDGETTASRIPALSETPGAWSPRDWASYTRDTGAGNPKLADADKGRRIFAMIVAGVTPILIQLSRAHNGDFPYVVRKPDGKPT
jgi:creatinine amidohydrolase